MDEKIQKDRIRGSLIGGAIGDALGYPVEFLDSAAIQRKYGNAGITRLDIRQWWRNEDNSAEKAWISDDTQMTLFTACGILNAKEKGSTPVHSICEAYIEWYYTQSGRRNKRFNECWIGDIPELNQRRAPGNTCLTALSYIMAGKNFHNNSKGCGGVMRIAPIPLYGVAQGRISDIDAIDRLAADAAELTHQHPLGFIPAAFTAHVIYRLATDEHPQKETFKNYIREGLESVQQMFGNHAEEVGQFIYLIKKAMLLSHISTDDVRAIEDELGGGWVAEETAAIAIYCALSYFESFEKAMIAAVNHTGDSDSTGAVTGNLLGAAIGYDAIPQFYKNDLELHDVILHIADDLYLGETTPYRK
ncbi:ADP-ribosylglycohydrolase family protein [Bacteroides oleiciplenus]|uniref:ADP-ribosylglycohydrolase family protein n=1 Tax=Bacteroides oleiciplenus TaxID=626931 RepID=UPI0026DAD1F0|nr:ADP-ribosylglycohydrolase family protein [Bacteroides oleiciplenus]